MRSKATEIRRAVVSNERNPESRLVMTEACITGLTCDQDCSQKQANRATRHRFFTPHLNTCVSQPAAESLLKNLTLNVADLGSILG